MADRLNLKRRLLPCLSKLQPQTQKPAFAQQDAQPMDIRMINILAPDRLAKLLVDEIAWCKRSDTPAAGLLLRKYVVETPADQRPTPNGSSLAYLELADASGKRSRAADDAAHAASPLLSLCEDVLQDAVARSVILKKRLLDQ